jgi:hypothetical protein
MNRSGLLAVAVLLLPLFPTHAKAGVLFGHEEWIHPLAPVALPGPGGADLMIAHKVSAYFCGAGLFVYDDGYVLARRGETHSYYPLPSPADVARYQAQGLLPTPLPPYHIPIGDYVLGYSWLPLLGITMGLSALARRFARQPKPILAPGRLTFDPVGKRLIYEDESLHPPIDAPIQLSTIGDHGFSAQTGPAGVFVLDATSSPGSAQPDAHPQHSGSQS